MLVLNLGFLTDIPHHSANAAIAFFISAVAAKTRLGDCLDRSLNGRARTGGREGEVDSGGNRRGSHREVLLRFDALQM